MLQLRSTFPTKITTQMLELYSSFRGASDTPAGWVPATHNAQDYVRGGHTTRGQKRVYLKPVHSYGFRPT